MARSPLRLDRPDSAAAGRLVPTQDVHSGGCGQRTQRLQHCAVVVVPRDHDLWVPKTSFGTIDLDFRWRGHDDEDGAWRSPSSTLPSSVSSSCSVSHVVGNPSLT